MKQIKHALALLNSMIEGNEKHTESSHYQVIKAWNEIDKIEEELNFSKNQNEVQISPRAL